MHLTVCSCHVIYGHGFQSESKVYICLNVKELFAQNMREIGTLSDCNWTGTHNNLVHKQTLNYSAKPTKVCVQFQLQSLRTCGTEVYLWYRRKSERGVFWLPAISRFVWAPHNYFIAASEWIFFISVRNEK